MFVNFFSFWVQTYCGPSTRVKDGSKSLWNSDWNVGLKKNYLVFIAKTLKRKDYLSKQKLLVILNKISQAGKRILQLIKLETKPNISP